MSPATCLAVAQVGSRSRCDNSMFQSISASVQPQCRIRGPYEGAELFVGVTVTVSIAVPTIAVASQAYRRCAFPCIRPNTLSLFAGRVFSMVGSEREVLKGTAAGESWPLRTNILCGHRALEKAHASRHDKRSCAMMMVMLSRSLAPKRLSVGGEE